MKTLEKNSGLFLSLILLLGLALYWNSLQFEFLINFDDDKLILESEANKSLSMENLKALFSDAVFGLYHPITSLTWAIEHQLYGFNAKWFHLTNILWHLLNTVLVFLLSKQFLKRSDWSLAVSLLFVVHPMHTENIVWLSARKDLVYGFFFLLGLLSYLKYLSSQKVFFYLLMVIAFIASLFSKSNAVVFPAVLILIDLFQFKKFKWKYVLNKIPLFILSSIFIFITLKTQDDAGFIKSFASDYTFLDRILMAIYSLAYYLVRLFLPFELSPKNLYPSKNDFLPFAYYVAPLILAAFAYFIYRLAKKEHIVWFGVLFFLIIIAPVLKIIPTGNDIVSNRYVYLPYIGLYLGISMLIFKYAARWSRYLLFAFAIAFTLYSFKYQSVYENSYTVWSSVIETNEGNAWGQAMAYNERGQIQLKKGQNKAAFRDIQKALELEPTLARALMNRALIWDREGQSQKALEDLNSLLAIEQENVDALKLRGVVYGKMQQTDLAIEDFNKAIELAPKNTELLNNRGIAYSIKGNHEKALADFNKAIELAPLSMQFKVNRGNLYVAMNDGESALKDYLWVYKKEPSSIQVAYPLAKLYLELDKEKQAEDVLKPFTLNQQQASEVAQRLFIDSLATYSIPYFTIAMGNPALRDQSLYQRAQAYKQIGESQNAIDDLLAILENMPSGQIFYEIGSLYWEIENAEKACEFWQEGAIRSHEACKSLVLKHCS